MKRSEISEADFYYSGGNQIDYQNIKWRVKWFGYNCYFTEDWKYQQMIEPYKHLLKEINQEHFETDNKEIIVDKVTD